MGGRRTWFGVLELDDDGAGGRACAAPGAMLVRGDACTLPCGDRRVDLVTWPEVREHPSAPTRAAPEAPPVGRAGCALYVPREWNVRLGRWRPGKDVARR
jgi:hypothetical protein